AHLARLAAALRSRSSEYPQSQINTRSLNVILWLRLPHREQTWLDGYHRSAIARVTLIAQLACEFGPASVSNGLGEAVITQHSGHIQILNHEPVVGLGELVRYPIQEVPANVADMVVV